MAEAVYLTAGLRLDPEDEWPTYYVLLAGEEGRPVIVDRQLVFFSHPDLLPAALGLAGMAQAAPRPGSALPKPDAYCDLAKVVYLIESQDADDEYGTVVNGLNLADDFLRATHAKRTPAYLKLTRLSRQLTFSRDMAAFFKDPANMRDEIIDTLLWCVGWIMTHARILQPHNLG
jgi:hypothetical protein